MRRCGSPPRRNDPRLVARQCELEMPVENFPRASGQEAIGISTLQFLPESIKTLVKMRAELQLASLSGPGSFEQFIAQD